MEKKKAKGRFKTLGMILVIVGALALMAGISASKQATEAEKRYHYEKGQEVITIGDSSDRYKEKAYNARRNANLINVFGVASLGGGVIILVVGRKSKSDSTSADNKD